MRPCLSAESCPAWAHIRVWDRKPEGPTCCLIFSPSVAPSFCQFLVLFFQSVVFVVSHRCGHADTCPSASVFSHSVLSRGEKLDDNLTFLFFPSPLRLLFSSRFSKMVWIRDTCCSALPLSCSRVFRESVRVFGWRTSFKKPGRQRERKPSVWTGQRSLGL